MKLSCTKENLLNGLLITCHLSNKMIDLPILQNVLIKAENGFTTFISTNLETAVMCSIRSKIDKTGEFTIPAKLFFDYVNCLPNETVNIEEKEGLIFIDCGSYKTKIKGISSSEFPLVPPVLNGKEFKISLKDLQKSIQRVIFSVAVNESRPELCGVCIKLNDLKKGKGKLTLAATDSYRLSENTIDGLVGDVSSTTIIVPSKTMYELNRILTVVKNTFDASENILIKISENQIQFSIGNVELISRTIEGNYPDYNQIIPNSYKTSSLVDKETFQKAIKTTSLFSKTGLFDVLFSFDNSAKKINISSTDTQKGENITNVDSNIDGENNSVTLNYKYLLDGISVCPTDNILFQMIDSSNPCVIKPSGKETEDFQYIIMPIKK